MKSGKFCGKEISPCNGAPGDIPGIDRFRNLINQKCNVNNFPIDTHKNFKCVWEHAFKQGKLAPIEDHPDYARLMDKYAIKGKCGYISCQNFQSHPQYEKERQKWEKECLKQPITEHPEYLALMNKYAIKVANGSGACDSFVPCKDISRHPDYEKEKEKWMNEWCKQPITRHPDYRKEVERVLKNLLQQLGKYGNGNARCQVGGGELDAMVNLYGGACDVVSDFKCSGPDGELKKMYQDIVSGRSKPCPPIPIEQHPQYQQLVENITRKVRSDYGMKDGDCGVKRCADVVKEIKADTEKKFQDRVRCIERKCNQKEKDMKDDVERLKKKAECKIRDDKQEHDKTITDLKKQLECCKKTLQKCKTQPICEHPEYEKAIKNEQKKLLRMIKEEQQKCQSFGYACPSITNGMNAAVTGTSVNSIKATNMTKTVSTGAVSGPSTITIDGTLTVPPQTGGKKKRPFARR